MANSLEVRAPFLDSGFAQWTTSLPAEQKIHKREGKYILKRALEDRLPRDVLYRPKQGFAVPLADWFRGPLRSTVKTALSRRALSAKLVMVLSSTLINREGI